MTKASYPLCMCQVLVQDVPLEQAVLSHSGCAPTRLPLPNYPACAGVPLDSAARCTGCAGACDSTPSRRANPISIRYSTVWLIDQRLSAAIFSILRR